MFPIAPITSYHIFSGLKQHKFIILQFYVPEIPLGLTRLKSKCQQACIPPEDSKGKSLSLPITATRGHLSLLPHKHHGHKVDCVSDFTEGLG